MYLNQIHIGNVHCTVNIVKILSIILKLTQVPERSCLVFLFKFQTNYERPVKTIP